MRCFTFDFSDLKILQSTSNTCIQLLFEESDYLKEEQKTKLVSVYVVPLPDALEVLVPYMEN